jgi:ring-1,2-phenylacetyl-CoA epoxidase subunit PaaC
MSRLEFVLGLGDDALVTAQRLAEWTSRAHDMEEDIALANIALDHLGVARELLTYAGELEGAGRTEDDLAFLRDAPDFRNVHLAELPNGDFAKSIVKLLFLSTFSFCLYGRESASSDQRLAGIAAKAVKESAYHRDHATRWTIRLGDGTEESHRRMQTALDELWPYTDELFDLEECADLRPQWTAMVAEVLAPATLDRPADSAAVTGGRRGVHTEALTELLAEMQVLHRAHPGARW